MNKEQIKTILEDAAGNPSMGPVADILPTLADALDEALNPKATTEQRVIKAKETR